jgi:hypothetical protein
MSTDYHRVPHSEVDAPGGEIGSILTCQYEKDYLEGAIRMEKYLQEKASE